jgi:hypothetical protein
MLLSIGGGGHFNRGNSDTTNQRTCIAANFVFTGSHVQFDSLSGSQNTAISTINSNKYRLAVINPGSNMRNGNHRRTLGEILGDCFGRG